MSIYKNIKKIPYSTSKDDLISLKQYMLVESDEGKYLLLEMINNFPDTLKSLKLEISQFDENENIIEISNFKYEDFAIKYKKEFVPYSKISVKNNCESIKIRLINAIFEDYIHENGVTNKIVKEIVDKKKDVKEKKEKVERTYFSKRNLDIRNIFRTIIVIGLLAFAFTFCGIYVNSKMLDERDKITELEDDDFHYIVKSRYELYIDECYIEEDTITIPEKKYDYKIIGLDKNIFKDSTIKSIVINAEKITIGENAFQNCTLLETFSAKNITEIKTYAFDGCSSLKKINATGVGKVKSYAFNNCTSLENFIFEDTTTIDNAAFNMCSSLTKLNTPNAYISINGLSNANSVEELYYGDTNVTYLGALFNCSNDLLPISLLKVSTGQKTVFNAFFENARYIKEIKLTNVNTIVQYNSFVGCNSLTNHSIDDNMEKLNNIILSYNVTNTSLVLNSAFDNMMNNAFYYTGKNVIELTINNNLEITSTLLNTFPNIQVLNIGTSNTLADNCLYNNSYLREISLPASDTSFKNLIGNRSITYDLVTVVGSRAIPADYFKNASIKELNISSTVKDINNNAFRDLKTITCITIPNNKKYSDYNMPSTITDVTIISGSLSEIKTNYFTNLENLYSINIGSGITSCEKNIVNNCKNLNYLSISNTTTSFKLPVIGKNCDNLKRVSIPFVGESITSSCTYEEYNLSYNKTVELLLNNSNATVGNLLEDNNGNITSLKISGNVTNSLGVLSKFINLKTIELTNAYGSNFGYCFGYNGNYTNQKNYVPSTIETVKISCTSLPQYYFYNCINIKNIYLLSNINVLADTFYNCSGIKNVYVSKNSNISSMATCINAVSNDVNIVYQESITTPFSKNNIHVYDNIDYNTYQYTIFYGKEYIYNDVFITDINDCLNKIVNDYDAYVSAYLTSYSSKISDGYFGSSSSVIYTREQTNYTISTYVSDTIKVNLYSDNNLEEVIELLNGDTLEYIALTKNNYIFCGWYENSDFSGDMYDFSSDITKDIKLYAKWMGISSSYNIINDDVATSCNINGKNTTTFAYYSLMDQMLIIDFTADTNIFGYVTDANRKTISTNENASADFKLNCTLKKNQLYYINVNGENSTSYGLANLLVVFSGIGGSSKVTVDNYELQTSTRIISNESFNLGTVVKNGFEFMGWYTEKNGNGIKITDSNGDSCVTSINSNLNVYAYYVKIIE